MSSAITVRHFFAPFESDFTSIIQAYITGVSSLTTNGVVSTLQVTRYNASGFVDQQYDLITYATSTNDASILSFINSFIASNPGTTFDTLVESASQGV